MKRDGGMRCATHRESEHPTFRNAPEDVLQVVYEKLAEQKYAHYVDEELKK